MNMALLRAASSVKDISFVLTFVWGLFFAQAQLPTDFQKVELLTGLRNATTMQFAPDGRIFILDRYGEVTIYKPDSQSTVFAGNIPVFHEFEDGLLGIAFDPDFTANNHIYLHYAVQFESKNRVSRFTMNGDTIAMDSEIVMLEWNTQRALSLHSGGDMAFDSQGNLYIAIGDNTDHGDYGALSETDFVKSAEKSSSNSNDLRGKVLRITPQPDGTYSIPSGNLFPEGTPNTKPEIYVMGARNPYRIFVDKENTDWLFWGEVGPDANSPSTLGPEGLDEMNLVKTAGNYGWPYFSGVDNDSYLISYASPQYYNDPATPKNNSTWNTGLTNLPAAKPAWLEFFHKSYLAGVRYYFDDTLTDLQRLPIEFDGMFFYYDFNTSKIWAVKMDSNGDITSNEQLAPLVFPSSQDGLIDMEIGPDGHMYLLAYGTGCCPSNTGTGKLIRVDYTAIVSNTPPTVSIGADVQSGSLPLTVNFSSDGTFDPDGDLPLNYAWDFQTDGVVDSTEENPTFTFTSTGTFNVQLKVDDGNGGIGVQNLAIYAGNNVASISFDSPVDGGFMNWDDDVNLNVAVSDPEDGSTANNGIDCQDVNIIPSLGHLNHFHDLATIDGCPKILNLDPGSHDIYGEMDIFFVINANYTDQGGLTSFDQITLHPKRKEAEFYSTGFGVEKISNTDDFVGGSEAIRVDHGGYISFDGRNLLNINAVKYRVATATQGGTIEFRIDSPNGPLLATAAVPTTGGADNWIDIETTFTDPGGKHDLFFVFKGNPGQQDIFDLNYVEFIGSGVSIDNSPPDVVSFEALSSSQTLIHFNEYVTQTTAENISNYMISDGINTLSAELQENDRSVLITYDQLTLGEVYQLTIQGVQNHVGLPVVPQVLQLSQFNAIAINSGGLETQATPNDFIADQYVTGGSLYTNSIPISNTTDDAIYQTERFGAFTYNIPLQSPGEFDLRLHFAELYFGVGNTPGGVGSRIFNVSIEGNTVLTNFDILNEVGPATALIKEFDNVLVTDGFVTIQFSSVVQNPKVSAIEILSPDTFDIAPTIAINSPQNGADVDQSFEVSFTVQNWEIQERGTHMHYYIDDAMVGPHYSYGPIAIENLSLGTHTIKLELFNPDHSPTGIYDEISVNVTDQSVCNTAVFPDQWQVHELEDNELPYRSVYILPNHDLDGDGLKDIATGGWWYKNPGSASGNWLRSAIGGSFNNVAYVYDFDGDGDMDLLGTTGAYTGADMVWAENNGSGNFTVHANIPSGDTDYSEPFLAGIAGGFYQTGGPFQMAINWNGAESTGSPMQLLSVPADPVNTSWTLIDISDDSLGEDVKAGDIDGDGDLDLFQSSNWLRNEGNGSFTTFQTGISYVTTPDRAQLADFDGDGDLDAVVGQLGLGSNTERHEFAWFEAPDDPTQNWTKHILATDINGSLSVFVSDIDFDGDEDIVVGEWKGSNRLIAFQNDLCNSGTWIRQTIDAGSTGFDHHDGAQVVDIDNDGDLDIVSIGWDNIVPRIFENKSVATNSAPITDAGPDRDITLPTSDITLSGTGDDPDGGAVTFLWSQVSGPNTASLTGTDTADLTASGLVEGDYLFRLTVTDDENGTAIDEVAVTVLPEPAVGGFALRINTGGPEASYNGEDFMADGYFATGSVLNRPQTGLPQPYSSIRFSRSQRMSYDIPVPDGEYTVRLHFAEVWFGATGGGSGGVGSRVFDVSVEGQLVEDDLDIFAEVGADAMLVKAHTVSVTGGVLDIDFDSRDAVGGERHPVINAIEILGDSPTTQDPIADAGNNLTITLPQTTSATFNGSGNDPDGGQITDYEWSQISGPNTAELSGENTSDLTVTGLLIGNYVFRLTVTDDENETGFDDVALVVQSGGGSVPIVNSGQDQTITLPTSDATLNGSGSDPDGGAVTFLWSQISGPGTATLSNAATADLTASGLVEGDYRFRLTVTDDENDTAFDEVTVSVLPVATGNFALRINTGGPQTTYNGNDFVADQYFDTGSVLNRPQTGLPQPYSSIRYSPSRQMAYDIPLANGEYTVILHFAEVWFGATGGGSGGVGSRIFDVTMEGQLAEDNLDIFAEAGADAMLVKTHSVSVTDGVLDLDFDSRDVVGGERHPLINAIEILGEGPLNQLPLVDAGADLSIELPADSVTLSGTGDDPDGGAVTFLWSQVSGPNTASLTGTDTADLTASGLVEGDYLFRLTVTDDENGTAIDEVAVTVLPEPVVGGFALRINTGGPEASYNGEDFMADGYFDTGSVLNRPQTGLPQPYSSIRFSRSQRMSYDIPVPDGEYTVRLHFAEVWFGATGGGSGGVGSRVFDVSVEGQLVEDDLDIFAEVGADAMLVKAHTVSVTGGVLDIDFDSRDAVDGERHPVINAIEVLGTASGGSGKFIIGQDKNDIGMSIYPNQASTFVTLSFKDSATIERIFVFDILGRLVRSYDPNKIKDGTNYIIDVNLYQQGSYIIKTIDEKGESFQKQLLVRRH